jgi:predicted nucleic acid-binding protein
MNLFHFIDANIFIRHLTQDHPDFSPACTALLARAERNEVLLTTSESVVTEVVQVLSSPRLYHLPRRRIAMLLTALLSISGMKCPGRAVYLRALSIYARENIDFPDCLTVAHMEQTGITELYSYDTDFDRFERIHRRQPT